MENTSQQLKLNFDPFADRNKAWQKLISQMTTEQIEMRSLLVSMSGDSEENQTFQKLLTIECNKRKSN